MNKSFFFLPVFILFLSLNISADQVIMTNDDRLTGKIVKKESDSITIQTEFAGTVKIKWSAVVQIIADEALSVTLADGKIVKEKIEAEEESVRITVAETKNMTIVKKDVKTVRILEDQEKYEAEQKRIEEDKFFDFWSGTVDVGFIMTSGNSDTRTFNAGMKGVRETRRNKFMVYANALQVKDTSNNTNRIKAQSVWTCVRYDIDINPKYFAFGSGDFEHNQPQKLNIRAVLGGGLDYHAFRKENFKLDLTGGVTNNYENFSNGIRRNSAEVLLGEETKFNLNSRVRFSERAVVYPNITRFGDFRALFDSSLETDINNWLGWHVTIGNRFNSRPVDRTEKNDFLLSTGLRFAFGKNKKKIKK